MHWSLWPSLREEFRYQRSTTSPFPLSYNLRNSVNTLRPRQSGRRFADATFKRIFLNENVIISIKISPNCVPKGPINNIPALIQMMARCRLGTSHYLSQRWLDYWHTCASLGLNELNAYTYFVLILTPLACILFICVHVLVRWILKSQK